MTWDFEMKNDRNEVVASVNKNWTNLARELFTDANAYVIRLGDHVLDPYLQQQQQQQEQTAEKSEVLPGGAQQQHLEQQQQQQASTLPQTVNTDHGVITAPASPLKIDEKALVLAATIAIDFDYFSHTSGGPGLLGWLPIPLPFPTPTPVEAPPTGGASDSADAAGASGGAPSGTSFGDEEGGRTKDDWGNVGDEGQQQPPSDDDFSADSFFGNEDESADSPPDNMFGDDDGGDDDEGGGVIGKLWDMLSDNDD